jgi:hypothetical protein
MVVLRGEVGWQVLDRAGDLQKPVQRRLSLFRLPGLPNDHLHTGTFGELLAIIQHDHAISD